MAGMLLWEYKTSWYVVWNCGCDWCREIVARNACSRPSEPVSPRRDLQRQPRSTLELSLKRRALVWARHLAQERARCLTRSRLGISPKRERVRTLARRCSF